MRLTVVLVLLTYILSHGIPIQASPSLLDLYERDGLAVSSANQVLRRDGHGHHNHHVAPLTELNETEVTLYHQPIPPSYYTIDWEGDGDTSETRHPGLMIFHGVCMILAFFVVLPVGIAMRSVRYAGHGSIMVTFYGLCTLGCFSSILYSKVTPNMYEGSSHGKHGYILLLLAVSLSIIDIMAAISRFISFVRSSDKNLRLFWRFVILNQEAEYHHSASPEYTGLIVQDPEEYEDSDSKLARDSAELQISDNPDTLVTEQWANDVHRHQRHHSTVSERTVFGTHSQTHLDDSLHESKISQQLSVRGFLRWTGRAAFAVLERALVLAGFGLVLTGIVVYTGGCRQNYVNGCLAHLIKGAIFWSYGLLTFARFLGSFAELGWSWNRAPSGPSYTAEFVESFVIFNYGVTNMWMERFGANPGDPFTTKQIQHISIAVMFCFAGLVGMGIESRRVRKWLASSTFASLVNPAEMPQDAVTEPPSYLASFNPFPALVIGVTGAAMAAHAQTYAFQVQIHTLWGNLLVAFAVMRCLTYFLVWLAPPKSILPSRPPTEALGSFFLACGGLVFMFSTEEVTIAAMRRGRDDVMMLLNVAVAITCFAFCWTLFIVGFKGWLKSRTQSAVTYRSLA